MIQKLIKKKKKIIFINIFISKLIIPYGILYLLLNLLVLSNIYFFFLLLSLFDKNKREEVMNDEEVNKGHLIRKSFFLYRSNHSK